MMQWCIVHLSMESLQSTSHTACPVGLMLPVTVSLGRTLTAVGGFHWENDNNNNNVCACVCVHARVQAHTSLDCLNKSCALNWHWANAMEANQWPDGKIQCVKTWIIWTSMWLNGEIRQTRRMKPVGLPTSMDVSQNGNKNEWQWPFLNMQNGNHDKNWQKTADKAVVSTSVSCVTRDLFKKFTVPTRGQSTPKLQTSTGVQSCGRTFTNRSTRTRAHTCVHAHVRVCVCTCCTCVGSGQKPNFTSQSKRFGVWIFFFKQCVMSTRAHTVCCARAMRKFTLFLQIDEMIWQRVPNCVVF